MSTTNNTDNSNKLRRKRIFKEITMQGEVVAKSYVNLDFRKTVSRQIILYSNISYHVIERVVVAR